MYSQRLVCLVVIGVICFSVIKVMGALSPLDPSSFSRPELAKIKHIDLTYDVDFEKTVLHGTALYNIEVLDYIDNVIFDTRDLTIEKLELEDGTPLQFTLDDPTTNFGSKLTIILPQSAAPEQKTNPFVYKIMTPEEREQAVKKFPNKKVPMIFDGFSYKPRTPYFNSVEETPCDCIDMEQLSPTCTTVAVEDSPSKFFMNCNNM